MYWISIKALRAKAQKADYGYEVYPLVFRFIRVISIYFTWLLIQTKCKPNTITVFGVLFGVSSGVMFYLGFVGAALTLVALAIIADFSDGEVSRFHGTSSKEGSYLDSIHHFVVQPFFIAGIVLWFFEINGNHFFLAAGMLCVINSILLTLAVACSVENALLKHLLRHIKNGGHFTHNQPENLTHEGVTVQDKRFFRTIPGTVARIMDFPYVIIIMGAGVALTNYLKDSKLNLDGSLMAYMIYTHAVLSSALICVFVWNVVHTKHIEKRLNEVINA